MTYEDLFIYVFESLHERTGKLFGKVNLSDLARACSGDLEIVRAFAHENNLYFDAIRAKLQQAGGYCDCEVLFHSRERIPRREALPEVVQV